MGAFYPIRFIFHIDDDWEDIGLFREALQQISPGIQFDSAVNMDEAMEKLENTILLPDIILLDLNMVPKNGKEGLIAIKSDDRLKNVPVIIYTTSDMAADKDATKKLGAAHFVTKPALFDDLKRIVTELLAMEFEE